MQQTSIISPLDAFRVAFPGTRIIVLANELRYRFRYIGPAKIAEKLAQDIILQKGLRITADLEIWSVGGLIRDISLVVKLVPKSI